VSGKGGKPRKYPGIKGARRPDKAYLRRIKKNGGAL
jgi:hypothetical protein